MFRRRRIESREHVGNVFVRQPVKTVAANAALGDFGGQSERASDRLLRMLGMITYLDRHEGVPVEAIAGKPAEIDTSDLGLSRYGA